MRSGRLAIGEVGPRRRRRRKTHYFVDDCVGTRPPIVAPSLRIVAEEALGEEQRRLHGPEELPESFRRQMGSGRLNDVVMAEGMEVGLDENGLVSPIP